MLVSALYLPLRRAASVERGKPTYQLWHSALGLVGVALAIAHSRMSLWTPPALVLLAALGLMLTGLYGRAVSPRRLGEGFGRGAVPYRSAAARGAPARWPDRAKAPAAHAARAGSGRGAVRSENRPLAAAPRTRVAVRSPGVSRAPSGRCVSARGHGRGGATRGPRRDHAVVRRIRCVRRSDLLVAPQEVKASWGPAAGNAVHCVRSSLRGVPAEHPARTGTPPRCGNSPLYLPHE
jgi:hypothetical protein